MTPLAFDLSAMFVGAANDTPRGIDRVDLGYAKRIFSEDGGDNLGLLPSLTGMGTLGAREARNFLRIVERRWREQATPGDDDALTSWLRSRIAGDERPRPPRRRGSQSKVRSASRYGRLFMRSAPALLRPAVRALPRGSVYINTGQILVQFGRLFKWLEERPDVKPVFMLHDVIPILYPEYCGPDMTRQHRRALETVIRRAAAMIATSETSAAEIHDMLKERGRSDMPIKVTRLPVDDSFLVERGAEPHRSADPYFVVVGAIDQRKNHRMLLNVWREIAREGARKAPKLLVIGARSLRSEGIVDFMSRCPALVDTVIETNGLSTPAMREFIRDARALLMPSFTEGFGLPIIEALALGTPVIASDIEAHREVGGAFAHYIDPLDGAAWQDVICARASESDAQLQERRNRLSHFAPQTWTSYFEDVMPFIYSL